MIEQTERYKAFIFAMLSEKKQLTDYPDKVSKDIVIHQPASLPFGGTYKGYEAFDRFYRVARAYYDFSRVEMLNLYGASNVVFAIMKMGVANTNSHILICEQFIFEEDLLVEIRSYLFDFAPTKYSRKYKPEIDVQERNRR
jgi:hypothetical protein